MDKDKLTHKHGKGEEPSSKEEVHLYTADGELAEPKLAGKSEREVERREEEQEYIPVILKRSDQAKRHPDDILEHAINEGVRQHKRRTASLLLSAVAAGLILSFTAMAVGVATAAFSPHLQGLQLRIATAFFYPLGFIVCLLSGTQLFTEHTATAFYPVLDRKAAISSVIRVWSIVIIGNLVGAYWGAYLLMLAGGVIGADAGFVYIADHLVAFPSPTLFISAVLAGWLMAQGGWLILATPPTISQLACIYIVTFLIGVGGLHHSIAGAVEIFLGYLISDAIGIAETGRFIFVALLGNLIGGSFFVALLNYAHVRKTQIYDEKAGEKGDRGI